LGVGLVISHLSANCSGDVMHTAGGSWVFLTGVLTEPRQNRDCFHSPFESAGLVPSRTQVFPTRARQNRALAEKGDGSAGLVSPPPPPGLITSLTVGLLPGCCRDTPYLVTLSRQSTWVGAKHLGGPLTLVATPTPAAASPLKGGLAFGYPSRASASGLLGFPQIAGWLTLVALGVPTVPGSMTVHSPSVSFRHIGDAHSDDSAYIPRNLAS